MAGLSLSGVTRRFGGRAAVDGIDLEVADGECLALLGPSGCGKTTLLRLVAGFERPDAGTIRIGGDRVTGPGVHVEPEERRVGVVFQSYALWPHLSVGENVAYALRVRRTPRAEREARVAAALATVGLDGFGARRIQELSGGQRQRVALARCLAMEPRVVLFDEPLANLDAALRETMLGELRRFHRATGATTIYVTHDQAEAMALANRVAVMHEGRLLQVAAPRRLHAEPACARVARFLSRGSVVPVDVLAVSSGRARVRVLGGEAVLRCPLDARPGPAEACLRPEDIRVAADGVAARVVEARFMGDRTRITLAPVAAPGIELFAHVDPDVGEPEGALQIAVTGGWVLPHA